MALVRRTRPSTVTGFPACAIAITPSDTVPLLDHDNNPVAMTIYVGVAGDVVVVPIGNDLTEPVTFTCPAGGLVPVEVNYVLTATTASSLVGLF